MDDAELRRLLERTGLGDRQAFQALYEKASPRLFAVCLRVLQDRAEAEDALQDGLLKIWRYAERFPAAEVRALTWMIAIVRNTAIDKLRARRGPSASLDAAEAVADATMRPDEKVMARSNAKRLLDCINGLGDSNARIVRIAYFGGATYAALAERDGVPLGTLKSRMRRALSDLKLCLER